MLVGATFLPSSPPIVAQAPETQWFYGLDAGYFEVFAYTLDGQKNIVWSVTGSFSPFFQFPDQSLLVFITYWDDTVGFIHLSPTGSQPIDFDTNREWQPIAQTERYGLIATTPFPEDMVIYDSQTRTFERLPRNFDSRNTNARFSADGAYLRYYNDPEEMGHRWSIMERHLESGEERIVFSVDQDTSKIAYVRPVPDEYGDRWIWTWSESETDIRQTDLIHIDGSVSTLIDSTTEASAFFSMQDHQLVESPVNCADECILTIHRLDETPITVQSSFLEMDSLNIIDDTGVLAGRDGHFWLLTKDAPPQYLGFKPSHYPSMSFQTVSPDYQWITLLGREEDPVSILIWDLANRRLAARFEHADGQDINLETIYYRPNGLVFETYAPYTALWFDYQTAQLTPLPYPDEEYRHYFELLPDNTFLLFTMQRNGEPGLREAYGLYDPATDTLSLTLPQGWWGPMTLPEIEQQVFTNP
jgi:hypothetical protein